MAAALHRSIRIRLPTAPPRLNAHRLLLTNRASIRIRTRTRTRSQTAAVMRLINSLGFHFSLNATSLQFACVRNLRLARLPLLLP
jgi:hypothetical protein